MRLLQSLLLLTTIVLSAVAAPQDVVEDAVDLRLLGDRSDGTAGEKAALQKIRDSLESSGVDYRVDALDQIPGGHSYSSNIIAEIPGSVPGRFVLAAPIDGGAFATALLLEMARDWAVSPPRHRVVLAFLGAERGDSELYPFGTRQLAEVLGDEDAFVLHISGDSVPRTWRIRIGGDGHIAPSWLLQALSDVLTGAFLPYELQGTDINVARAGLQGGSGALEYLLAADIPGIGLRGSGVASPADRNDRIERTIEALKDLDYRIEGIPNRSDRNYIFLRPLPGMVPRIIPELPYVVIFLGITALLLALILIQFRKVQLNFRRFARYWWTGPLLAVVVFLFLFLSTLIIEETVLLADVPDLWRFSAGIFVFFKLAVAAALSLNFIIITRGLPLPRSPHYYSYAAITAAGLAMLVVMALDITLAVIPLGTVVLLLLQTMSRRPLRKGFFLTIAFVPYLAGLVVIVAEPYDAVVRTLLFSRIGGNAFLALLLLPFILTVTGLNYWRVHYQRTRRSVLTPAATMALTLAALVTLVWILSLEPYGPNRPQPVAIADVIDLVARERHLDLESPAPIGDAQLRLDGEVYDLDDLGRRAEVRMPPGRTPLELSHISRRFLGRRTITVTIDGEPDPGTLILRLEAESPFTLHQSAQPFEMEAAGDAADIFIGRYPPFPFSVDFTVNADAELSLLVEARWDDPVDPPTIVGGHLSPVVRRSARLRANL